MPLRVGLTGGIGAGKSEVARRLAALGVTLIDADQIAREVVEPGTPGLAAIVEAFGPAVLHPDGTMNRELVGSIVFSDPAQLARLNAITHPLIERRMAELERAAESAQIVVADVPLIAESGLGGQFDVVVVVDAPAQTQLDRLVQDRSMDREQALARMTAQASRERRLEIADIVIDNSGSLDDLDRQVRDVWDRLTELAAVR